jgi:hypothetical protein
MQCDRFLQTVQPEVVFLAAYLSNVDYCELYPDETHKINVGAG